MAISTPSIRIRPPALSRIRNKAKAKEDLPAPVRPTMPTCREENNSFKRAYDLNKFLLLHTKWFVNHSWFNTLKFKVKQSSHLAS